MALITSHCAPFSGGRTAAPPAVLAYSGGIGGRGGRVLAAEAWRDSGRQSGGGAGGGDSGEEDPRSAMSHCAIAVISSCLFPTHSSIAGLQAASAELARRLSTLEGTVGVLGREVARSNTMLAEVLVRAAAATRSHRPAERLQITGATRMLLRPLASRACAPCRLFASAEADTLRLSRPLAASPASRALGHLHLCKN